MTGNRLVRLVFVLLGVLLIMAAPVQVFAQEGKGSADLDLQLTPGYFPFELAPGQDNFTYMEVRNNGNLTLNNIRFSAGVPEGWRAEFNPASLPTLSPGSSFTIDVNIIPAATADRQNYNITLIAEADETRTVSNLFLTVERNTNIWTWVGIGLGVAALLGFIFIFLRSNRQ